MTLRDVLVQIGFLMVTAGAMLATWAVLTRQFSRAEPEAIPAEPAEEAEFEVPVVHRREAPPRATRPRAQPSKAAKPRTRAKPGTAERKQAAAKPRPRKPRPSA